MKTIPERELRNHTARVLKAVEAGERLRVTVNGRPVADLVPVEGVPRTFVAREQLEELVARASLDPGFESDIREASGATIDEL